jgi:hypothetical protein
MKALDRRLSDLEQRLAPTAGGYLLYQEQLEGPYVGMFARTMPDGSERYVTREGIEADAAGSTAILIEYRADLGPVDLPSIDSIQLPSNGRSVTL